ncbi:MAG TPA: SpoIID/LytB domain-containing protein, partial [Candidatus Dormibacteraeota bacterium]|nr:SpoIID/LytB domain-containing protein [Candidatus Dormibacteraeota bacterium]
LQAQANSEKANLDQLTAQEAAARQALAQLRAALSGKQEQVAQETLQAQALDNQIAALQAQEDQLTQAHDRRLHTFSLMLRESYKRSPGGTLIFVLGASSFSDLLDRVMSSLRISRFNLQEADRLRQERDQLDLDRRRTADLAAALAPILAQLAADAASVGAAVGSQAALASSLEAQQRQQLGALQGTLAKQKQLEAALAAQQAAAAAAAQKAQQGGGVAYGSVCPTAPAGKVLICGHGWGHGVGMSQFGALGMAQSGYGWQAILTHFYSGVSIGGSPDQTMRVWLHAAGATVTPEQAPATLQDTTGRVLGTVAAGQGVAMSAQSDGSVVGKWAGGQARAKPLRLVPAAGGVFQVSGNRYRGEAWADAGSGLRIIDHVDIEAYLQGLGEVPSSWPVVAIEAQTVAARTYALYHLSSSGAYDVDDTTAYQVYLGVDRESANQDSAVAGTRGQVLLYQGQLIDAFFSSSDGGHSQCASAEFTYPYNPQQDGANCTPGYLKGVIDNYDFPRSSSDPQGDPLQTWYTPAYTLAQIQQFMGSAYNAAQCGGLTGFDLTDRDASDRLNTVRMVGSRGVCTLSPGAFIRAFNAGSPKDAIVWGEMFGVTPGNRAWPYW